MSKPPDLLAIATEALLDVAIHDPDGYLAADANKILEGIDKYADLGELLEALSDPDVKILMHALAQSRGVAII